MAGLHIWSFVIGLVLGFVLGKGLLSGLLSGFGKKRGGGSSAGY